jgi:hypothetical protein
VFSAEGLVVVEGFECGLLRRWVDDDGLHASSSPTVTPGERLSYKTGISVTRRCLVFVLHLFETAMSVCFHYGFSALVNIKDVRAEA